MKIGRNDPCPCGSGQKYKKCCMDSAPSAPLSSASQAPMATGGVKGVSPYIVAKLAAAPRSAAGNPGLLQRLKESLRRGWSIPRVARMSTDEIEAQLLRYGVRYTRERFLAQSENRVSAWSVSEVWFAEDPVKCKRSDEDFLGLAACELWKRLIPERPSMEMLDDWMQEGYDHQERGDSVAACEAWWKVWSVMVHRFSPAMTTTDLAEEAFLGTQSIYNWTHDLSMELHNASLVDSKWEVVAVQFGREFIAQFRGEDELTQVGFRRDLAEALFATGETAEAMALLDEIVRTWPKNPWGYVALADVYMDEKSPLGQDLVRAMEWLKLGKKRVPAGSHDGSVLDERLAEIGKMMAG